MLKDCYKSFNWVTEYFLIVFYAIQLVEIDFDQFYSMNK